MEPARTESKPPAKRAGDRREARQGTGGASPGQAGLRDELKGLNYREGVERLRPRGREPEPVAAPRGSATIVAAAGSREWAFDRSFSPALQEVLRAHPGRDLADVLAEVAQRELVVGSPEQDAHHPTLAQVGARPRGPASFRAGRKEAVLVANQNYVGGAPLETPAEEAAQFHDQMVARGFHVKTAGDLTAAEMRDEFEALVVDAEPEDQRVGYFSGHGSPQGLVGVLAAEMPGDILPNAEVAGLVEQGVRRGAQMSFVRDSCHSGAAVRKVVSDQAARARQDPEAAGGAGRDGLRAVDVAEAARRDLMRFTRVWDRRVGPVMESILKVSRVNVSHLPEHRQLARERELQRLRDTRSRLERLIEPIAARIWNRWLPRLRQVAAGITKRNGSVLPEPPVEIVDCRTLGRQLDWLDDLVNQAMNPPAAVPGGKP